MIQGTILFLWMLAGTILFLWITLWQYLQDTLGEFLNTTNSDCKCKNTITSQIVTVRTLLHHYYVTNSDHKNTITSQIAVHEEVTQT